MWNTPAPLSEEEQFRADSTNRFNDISKLLEQLQTQQASQTSMDAQGYQTLGGGQNQHGIQKGVYTTLRGEDGNLTDKFKETMDPALKALQDKYSVEGDTLAARLQREQLKNGLSEGADNIRTRNNTALSQGADMLSMRGGMRSGAGERMAMANQRGMMGNLQNLGAEGRAGNLKISLADEQMKNNVLSQTGKIGQGIQGANIGRLEGDIRNQNMFEGKRYEDDMAAYGAEKTARAQRKSSSGGTVVCTAFKKRGLITDEQHKVATDFGHRIFENDCKTNGHSFKAYNYFIGKLTALMDRSKIIEKVCVVGLKPFVDHVTGKPNFIGKWTLNLGDFICSNLFYFTPKYNRRLIKTIKGIF